MPSNYTGVPANVTGAQVTLAEPIDGDSDNGVTFQTPMTTAADVLEFLRVRMEANVIGPAQVKKDVSAVLTTALGASAAGASGAGIGPPIAWAPVNVISATPMGRLCIIGVAAAAASICQTSDDGGNTWSTRASFNTAFGVTPPQAVYWLPPAAYAAGGTFIAVGGTKLATSPDGITWTLQTTVGAGGLLTVASKTTGTPIVVVSGNNYLAYSTNLTAWTAVTLAAPFTTKAAVVTWGAGPGLFVAAAVVATTATNAMLTSPDGVTWTQRTAPDANMCQSIAYAPALVPWYVVTSTTTNNAYTSIDGINWTTRAGVGWGGTFRDYKAWSGCYMMLFICENSTVAGNEFRSRDGITWQQITGPTDQFGGTANTTVNGFTIALGAAYWTELVNRKVWVGPSFPTS